MDLHFLSKSYTVRKLDEADVDAIFELMRKNEIFYKYHPPFVTKESILEDMKALPLLAPGDRDHILSGVFNQFLSALTEPVE